jgi:hypothetical protein
MAVLISKHRKMKAFPFRLHRRRNIEYDLRGEDLAKVSMVEEDLRRVYHVEKAI